MMAKTPGDPPAPRSPVLTAAASLALAGFSIGLFQLDSAVGLASERLGEPLAVAGTAVLRAAVADGDGVAVDLSVADAAGAVGAEKVAGAAGAGAAGGLAGATGGAGAEDGAGAGDFFAGGVFEGSVVGAGVGEPDGQCCVGRHNGSACAAPAAPAAAAKASAVAASPGTSVVRRKWVRIMDHLCSCAGQSRTESCPGYPPTGRRGVANPSLPALRRQCDLQLAHFAPAHDVAPARNEVGADPAE